MLLITLNWVRMHPFSRHGRFFSSLSQVEKRLASEKEKEEDPPPSPAPSLSSSPLFLSNPKPIQETAITNNDSSEPPLDFLSNSPTTSIPIQQHQADVDDDPDDEMDDIDRLMSLLGLSPPNCEDSCRTYSSCDCSIGGGGFFGKVVGVKRPRCGKEKERLDGWIASFYNDGKREPARLAHLLLGKAGGEFGATGFPATVADFLDHDPPSEKVNEE